MSILQLHDGDMWTDRNVRNERRLVVATARELTRPMLAGVSGPRLSCLRRADRGAPGDYGP
jgi:hypothetical protein